MRLIFIFLLCFPTIVNCQRYKLWQLQNWNDTTHMFDEVQAKNRQRPCIDVEFDVVADSSIFTIFKHEAKQRLQWMQFKGMFVASTRNDTYSYIEEKWYLNSETFSTNLNQTQFILFTRRKIGDEPENIFWISLVSYPIQSGWLFLK